MKTSQILLGAGLLAGGLFMTTVHETQVETITEQDALIDSLTKENDGLVEYVSELEQTLVIEREKLTEAYKRIELILQQNEQLNKRLDKLLEIEATGYTPECIGCSGITKSGHNVTERKTIAGLRVVATDPNVIPLGTIMIVHTSEGSFGAIALDIGGAIKGHKVDVLFLDKDNAKEFGRQKVFVEILGHIKQYKSL